MLPVLRTVTGRTEHMLQGTLHTLQRMQLGQGTLQRILLGHGMRMLLSGQDMLPRMLWEPPASSTDNVGKRHSGE